jgi:hypothetical protein
MTEPLRQRLPRIKDKAHLAFVRGKPCCVCGWPAPNAAAHIRMASQEHGKRDTGKAEKPSDRWTVPLCDPYFSPGKGRWCHKDAPDAQHSGDESAFWKRVGLDPFAIADALWVESGAADRPRDSGPRRAAKKRNPRPRPDRVKRAWPKRTIPKSKGFNR